METSSVSPSFAEQQEKRERKLFIILWIVFLAFFAGQFFFLYPKVPIYTALIRASALTGTTLISAALFSSALFKWHPRWAVHWHVRKYLGVGGFVFIFFHVLFVVQSVFGWKITSIFYTLNPLKNPLIFGAVAFPIFFLMAVTSLEWIVKKLGTRRWKTIHRLVYVAYPLSIFHFALTNPKALYNPFGYLLIAVTACAVFGQLYWFVKIASRKKFRSKGSIIGIFIIIASLLIAYLALTSK